MTARWTRVFPHPEWLIRLNTTHSALFGRAFRLHFPENTNLMFADLSEADLIGADLSGATLTDADLSEADLGYADLSEAALSDANLSGATLTDADLSEAALGYADLSEAALRDADLSEAALGYADLSEADIRAANLLKVDVASIQVDDHDEVTVNSRTKIGKKRPFGTGFFRGTRSDSPDIWDQRARGYEQLRKVFQTKGLDTHHRKLYSYQRRARAKEAIKSNKIGQWIANLLSRLLTGHGVSVTRVLFWTLVVILLPWIWYGLVGNWTNEPIEGGPLYYSIVTFVTAPPHPLPELQESADLGLTSVNLQTLSDAIVLFQTYAGTALIVLLGYVLGNRDRI